jgi:hypothetical protein
MGMVAESFEALAEVVDRLVDALEGLDGLTDGELDEALVALVRQRHRLAAVTGRLAGRWEARQVWAGDGSRSPAARLSRDGRCSLATARVELRRARALASMPATATAVLAGQLSPDHVDLLASARRRGGDELFARDEALLVDQCAELRFAQAQRMVEYWCQRADPDGAERDHERSAERAHLHASTTLDGEVVLAGRLDPVGGAIVCGELDRLEHELYLADQREGRVRTPAQRRAAALVLMAERSAAMPPDARRVRPLFTVLVGDDSVSRLCELANGTVIAPGALLPYLTAADLEVVLFDGPSTVISVSHHRRFAGALRRAIQVRDRHCQHPAGCDEPADRCDVDHIVPHAHDGPTAQHNGRLLCTSQNRHPHLRDPDPAPWPARSVTRLDEIRARLRWRFLRDEAQVVAEGDDRAGASTSG